MHIKPFLEKAVVLSLCDWASVISLVDRAVDSSNAMFLGLRTLKG